MGTPFDELLAAAGADPGVAGLVLTGSQARDMATGHSDIDVMVIVFERGGRWSSTSRTPELDTIVMTLTELADVSDRWQRYAYRGAQILLGRLDSRIADLANRQATLTATEQDAWVSPRTRRLHQLHLPGRQEPARGTYDLARLEEIEAAPWLLWTLFALCGRVR